jgi:hypothetical protein
MNAQGLWTLDELVTKIQNDLELHEEVFVTPGDITSFINDAIDAAEQIIIDLFSDFFLTYVDLTVKAGQTIIDLPNDLFESRMRGIYYNESGWSTTQMANQQYYKVKKMSLELNGYVQQNDAWQYRLVNSSSLTQKLFFFPAIDVDSDDRFRLWYIRRALRLKEPEDLLEKGLRPQYILSHAKCAIMQKEGDPSLDVELGNLAKQEQALVSALSRLTDDDEDSYLYPDIHALSEAYESAYWGDW